MFLKFSTFLAVFLIIFFIVENSYGKIHGTEGADKYEKLRMTPKTMDKMKNLHKNSYHAAIKAIIGKLGKELYKKLPKQQKRMLAKCLDVIEDKRELIPGAKCVVEARKRFMMWEKQEIELSGTTTPRTPQGWKSFLQQYDDMNRFHVDQNNHGMSQRENTSPTTTEKWWKTEEESTTVVSTTTTSEIPLKIDQGFKEVYDYSRNLTVLEDSLISNSQTPLKRVKILFNPEKKTKKSRFLELSENLAQQHQKYYINNAYKTMILPYSQHVRKAMTSRRLERFRRRFRRHLRFPDSKDHYFREQKFKVKTMSGMGSLKTKNDQGYAGSVAKVIHTFVSSELNTTKSPKWEKTYNRLGKIRKAADEQKHVPGAKVYEHRMYDIVLDRDEPSLSPKERKSPAGIIHSAMNFMSNLTLNDKTINSTEVPGRRILSPRFMPLMPADEGKKVDRMLSPDILSLYNDPNDNGTMTTNKLGSVPSLLKILGLTEKDRQTIMQTVMDITGSSEHIEEALKIYEYLGMFNEDISGPLFDATERMMNSFSRLEDKLQLPQKLGYEKRGFTFIKKKQLQELMRDQGLKEDEIDLADFDIYDKMTDEQMEESLWLTIENIAKNITSLRPSEIKKRQKRVPFVSPWLTVESPTILAPFMFTVQKGAVVLGPLILSPTVFCPPILNPSVLAPYILSPGVGDPFILSPYVFGPFILGPFVMTPFILTPYALSPNILNPYVLTSLILSPIALSPDILSPMVLSGSVLSPSVLSPAVFTPTYLTGSVLSPTFLS